VVQNHIGRHPKPPPPPSRRQREVNVGRQCVREPVEGEAVWCEITPASSDHSQAATSSSCSPAGKWTSR
jgi:hypothetical protein